MHVTIELPDEFAQRLQTGGKTSWHTMCGNVSSWKLTVMLS
jgi:hypothetical protein